MLYGSRAAKGVILITTKRGKEGPLTVSVRANTGWHVAKAYPEYLGSAEYMTLYNEARRNDGLSNLYSDEVIYHTAAKTNPYRYSDVNFYSDEYLKKVYNRTDADAEIYGGNGAPASTPTSTTSVRATTSTSAKPEELHRPLQRSR